MFGLLLSTNMDAVLVFCVVFLLVYKYLNGTGGRTRGLPPGPFALPVLGNILSLGTDPREQLLRMTAKYGDIFTIYLGPRRTIMLGSYDVIKEAFITFGHVFSGRPQDLFFVEEITKGYGIVSTEGELWSKQRKFVHNVLKEFGVGKSMLEEKIHEELTFFLSKLQEQMSTPFDPQNCIQISVSNIIYSIVFGERCDYNDPTFQQYMAIMKKNFEAVGSSAALIMFPMLKHVPGDPFKYKMLKSRSDWFTEQLREQVRGHRCTRQAGVTRDLIDAYLEEIDRLADDAKQHFFHDEQLVGVIGDLFGAGTETTATTLTWALVYMMHHPHIQQRVKAEIFEVIGPHRRVSMKDRSSLPYTEACILEVQRMADIVPLGVPHTVTEDIIFRGYNIPKGTNIMSNLYAVHRDADVWHEPYRFNPDRFLDNDGKMHRTEKMIPYSLGKRACLGESLARMELFLFFTSMIQKMTFSNPPGQMLPSTVGKLGATHMPHPFKVMAVPN